MRFFRGFRSKDKSNGYPKNPKGSDDERQVPSSYKRPLKDNTSKLPPVLLQKIFTFVCPHTEDDTYETCENSASDNACMLCDLRDLARCVRVSRIWRKLATNVLYHSIRIDVVHYCQLEELLAEKRKHRKFYDRNAEPEDVPQHRLRLLCRTLRDDNTGLGFLVRFLKLPYMTRETSKVDLARIVAVLPNLRYVDLPDGLFVDDSSCMVLKLEIQARCPEIRKMSYFGGSEKSFEVLASGTLWRNLEVVELNKLDVNPTTLRQVLASLPSLRALKITDMAYLDDSLFMDHAHLPPFPALTELLLEDTPKLTAGGMVNYLSSPRVQNNLQTLSFTTTGVHPETLHQILASAPRLSKLSIVDSVTTAFPNAFPTLPPSTTRQTMPLASTSLKILQYEITAATSPQYSDPTSSYYSYLTSSLLSGSLPNLKSLYVRDPTFPESLIEFTPPRPLFAGEPGGNRLSSNNPFASAVNGRGLMQQLEVYTKGTGSAEWNFSRVEASLPDLGGRRGSSASLNIRPISSYGLATSGGGEGGWGGGPVSPSWGGTFAGRDVRKSIVVSNGRGGFLAVPDGGPQVRPASSGSATGSIGSYKLGSNASEYEKRSSRYDT